MAVKLSTIRQAFHLLRNIDFDQLGRLSSKIDLPQVMATVGKMNDQQLSGLMKMLQSNGGHKKEVPPVNGDFYDLEGMLNPEDRALQLKVRAFMEEEVQPIVNEHWLKAEFPFEII